MPDQENEGLTPEELHAQKAEELPQRELMTVLEPPAALRPVPIEPLPAVEFPPDSA